MRRTNKDTLAAHHDFWNTQPVPQAVAEKNARVPIGPIESKTSAEVSKEPYPLPAGLEWWTPKVSNPQELDLIYELLRDNYVEDDDCMFRFNYSIDFLKWALGPPGYEHDWHVAVRRKADQKLMCFISGIPITVRMGPAPEFDAPRRICEINFLCVHKELRSKGMAPSLIKEVTRRVNLRDVWQAIYTAGVVIPTPFSSGQYFHRSLDPAKLIAIRFSRIPPQFEKFQKPLEMVKRHYNLPEQTACRGLRPMVPEDITVVTELLQKYLAPFSIAASFSVDEAKHWLLPRPNVVYSYVIQNEKTQAITDFISFYNLPSTVIGNDKYRELRAAYTFYYANFSVPLAKLMNDALILAKKNSFDVFNTVDILKNGEIVQELKFGPGDGKLNYYFYNWSHPSVPPSQVGLVML